MTAADYLQRTGFRQGRAFAPMERQSFMTIDILPFLIGRPWDDNALAAAHAHRPSWIRVLREDRAIQIDFMEWRVTVWLDTDDNIHAIEQEVVIGLPPDCPSASVLNARLTGETA